MIFLCLSLVVYWLLPIPLLLLLHAETPIPPDPQTPLLQQFLYYLGFKIHDRLVSVASSYNVLYRPTCVNTLRSAWNGAVVLLCHLKGCAGSEAFKYWCGYLRSTIHETLTGWTFNNALNEQNSAPHGHVVSTRDNQRDRLFLENQELLLADDMLAGKATSTTGQRNRRGANLSEAVTEGPIHLPSFAAYGEGDRLSRFSRGGGQAQGDRSQHQVRPQPGTGPRPDGASPSSNHWPPQESGNPLKDAARQKEPPGQVPHTRHSVLPAPMDSGPSGITQRTFVPAQTFRDSLVARQEWASWSAIGQGFPDVPAAAQPYLWTLTARRRGGETSTETLPDHEDGDGCSEGPHRLVPMTSPLLGPRPHEAVDTSELMAAPGIRPTCCHDSVGTIFDFLPASSHGTGNSGGHASSFFDSVQTHKELNPQTYRYLPQVTGGNMLDELLQRAMARQGTHTGGTSLYRPVLQQYHYNMKITFPSTLEPERLDSILGRAEQQIRSAVRHSLDSQTPQMVNLAIMRGCLQVVAWVQQVGSEQHQDTKMLEAKKDHRRNPLAQTTPGGEEVDWFVDIIARVAQEHQGRITLRAPQRVQTSALRRKKVQACPPSSLPCTPGHNIILTDIHPACLVVDQPAEVSCKIRVRGSPAWPPKDKQRWLAGILVRVFVTSAEKAPLVDQQYVIQKMRMVEEGGGGSSLDIRFSIPAQPNPCELQLFLLQEGPDHQGATICATSLLVCPRLVFSEISQLHNCLEPGLQAMERGCATSSRGRDVENPWAPCFSPFLEDLGLIVKGSPQAQGTPRGGQNQWTVSDLKTAAEKGAGASSAGPSTSMPYSDTPHVYNSLSMEHLVPLVKNVVTFLWTQGMPHTLSFLAQRIDLEALLCNEGDCEAHCLVQELKPHPLECCSLPSGRGPLGLLWLDPPDPTSSGGNTSWTFRDLEGVEDLHRRRSRVLYGEYVYTWKSNIFSSLQDVNQPASDQALDLQPGRISRTPRLSGYKVQQLHYRRGRQVSDQHKQAIGAGALEGLRGTTYVTVVPQSSSVAKGPQQSAQVAGSARYHGTQLETRLSPEASDFGKDSPQTGTLGGAGAAFTNPRGPSSGTQFSLGQKEVFANVSRPTSQSLVPPDTSSDNGQDSTAPLTRDPPVSHLQDFRSLAELTASWLHMYGVWMQQAVVDVSRRLTVLSSRQLCPPPRTQQSRYVEFLTSTMAPYQWLSLLSYSMVLIMMTGGSQVLTGISVTLMFLVVTLHVLPEVGAVCYHHILLLPLAVLEGLLVLEMCRKGPGAPGGRAGFLGYGIVQTDAMVQAIIQPLVPNVFVLPQLLYRFWHTFLLLVLEVTVRASLPYVKFWSQLAWSFSVVLMTSLITSAVRQKSFARWCYGRGYDA